MQLEILLSTMHRNNLFFLKDVFPDGVYKNYQILIINQTTPDNLIQSSSKNIRVLNSFEKGISNSRNLAIKNAKGDICLFADDDINYKSNFETVVLSAFKKDKDAGIITFQMVDKIGRLFKKYPKIKFHNKKSVSTANSVVIAFKRQKLINSEVKFNTHFGLGSTFETADEYVFLRNALKYNLKVIFEPQIILAHDFYSSGKAIESDRNIYAMSAVFYKYSGYLSYFRLLKHVYLIYKKGKINLKEIIFKYKVGLKGISKYKNLLKLEEN